MKNRGYAANCRVKRENVEERYKIENDQLREQIKSKYEEYNNVQEEIRRCDIEEEMLIKEAEELRKLYEQRFKVKAEPMEVSALSIVAPPKVETLLASRPEIKYEKI